MEITGKIKMIGAEQQVSASFTKRELVITTDETYPQHILVDFTQDRCDLLDPYKEGQAVTVSINLRGREWVNPQGETKYFNSIQGWRIQKGEQAAPQATIPPTVQSLEPASNFNEEEHDDLPFN